VKLPRLLLVDDDDSDRFIIKRYLSTGQLECEIDECRDGIEALAYFEGLVKTNSPAPDLILLDLNMPRLGGVEFLQKFELLCKREPSATTGVLVLLAMLNRDDERICSQFDFVRGFLSKEPESPREFTEKIARHIGLATHKT